MLRYSQYPDDLFLGSDETKQLTHAAMMRQQGRQVRIVWREWCPDRDKYFLTSG